MASGGTTRQHSTALAVRRLGAIGFEARNGEREVGWVMEIDEKLDRIEKKLDTLLSLLRANAATNSATTRPRADGAPPSTNGRGGEIASDADLDSARGDPEVRFIPKRWSGADMKGKRFSECEPEFLDMLADAF